jgi:hypothetical protein
MPKMYEDEEMQRAAEARRAQALAEKAAAARSKNVEPPPGYKRSSPPWATIFGVAFLVLVAFGLAGQAWGWFNIGTPPQ